MFFVIYLGAALFGALAVALLKVDSHWSYGLGFVVYGVINIAEGVHVHWKKVKVVQKIKERNGDG